jgi:hypothetical protein
MGARDTRTFRSDPNVPVCRSFEQGYTACVDGCSDGCHAQIQLANRTMQARRRRTGSITSLACATPWHGMLCHSAQDDVDDWYRMSCEPPLVAAVSAASACVSDCLGNCSMGCLQRESNPQSPDRAPSLLTRR